jgi:hypothetical protein
MAKSRQSRNGRLEDAMATALQTQAGMQQTLAAVQQNQASMQQTLTAFLAQMAEMKAESDRRFARIEAILLDHTRILQEHSRILQDHGRILQALPDALREKIGFKGTGRPG